MESRTCDLNMFHLHKNPSENCPRRSQMWGERETSVALQKRPAWGRTIPPAIIIRRSRIWWSTVTRALLKDHDQDPDGWKSTGTESTSKPYRVSKDLPTLQRKSHRSRSSNNRWSLKDVKCSYRSRAKKGSINLTTRAISYLFINQIRML